MVIINELFISENNLQSRSLKICNGMVPIQIFSFLESYFLPKNESFIIARTGGISFQHFQNNHPLSRKIYGAPYRQLKQSISTLELDEGGYSLVHMWHPLQWGNTEQL